MPLCSVFLILPPRKRNERRGESNPFQEGKGRRGETWIIDGERW